MLPQWYFCLSIDATPALTRAFLCMLDILADRNSDGRLVQLTFEELKRADLRMQIYALPYVISACRDHEAEIRGRELTREYLDRLVKAAPEDLSESLTALFDVILLGDKARIDALPALELYLKDLKNLPKRRCTPRPYLDLRDFLPETAALAVLADLCASNTSLAARVAELLGDEISDVTSFIHDALEHQFGRLAFLLAARITHLVPTEAFGRSYVEKMIWGDRSLAPAFEPDLLQVTAELHFAPNRHFAFETEKQKAVEELMHEAVWFPTLRRLWKMLPYEERKQNIAPLSVLGLEWSQDRELVLPLIFWQAVLWDLGGRLWPDRVATKLVKYWRAATNPDKAPQRIAIRHPLGNVNSQAVSIQLSALAKLRDLKPLRIDSWSSSRPSNADFAADGWEWIFLSPWVQMSGVAIKRPLYATGRDSQEVLIRLLAAVPVAINFLRVLPDSDPRRETFALLIAHAADVLTIFKNWLNNFSKPEKVHPNAFKLSECLTGLALFGRRLVNLAGTGRFDFIAPSVFVGLLEEEELQQQLRPRDELIFRTRVLPEVLMDWISDAYPGAIDDQRGGRWLTSQNIDKVYSDFTSEKHQVHDKLAAAMIVRFLRKATVPGEDPLETELDLTSDPQLNWQEASKLEQWELDHRQLLLTPRDLPVEVWDRGWQEPDWRKGLNKRGKHLDEATPMVRALERVACLKPGKQVLEATKELWEADWKRQLNGIDKKRNFSRYVRLRLLELIDDQAFSELNDQELILFVLLEYGSIYDLKELFERIFPIESGRLKSVDETRRQLQLITIRAMYRRLERDEINPDQNREQYAAQDPRDTFVYYQRADLIRETLTKLAYSTCTETDIHSELWNLIVDLEQESLNGRVSQTIRAQTAHVEQHDDKLSLMIPEDAQIVREGFLRGYVNDLNTFSATLFYDDLDLTGIDNLFESPQLSNHFLDNEKHDLLAVVVERSEGANTCKTVFNCGLRLDRPLEYVGPIETSPKVNVGDYVRLPITFRKRRFDLEIVNPGGITPVGRGLRSGDVQRLQVAEDLNAGAGTPRRLSLLRDGAVVRDNEIDKYHVDSDPSRAFQLNQLMQTEEVERRVLSTSFFRYDGKAWAPLDRGLINLLADDFSDRDVEAVVLSLIEPTAGALGESAWRFSTSPGMNYLIKHDQFSAEALQRIDEEISRIKAGSSKPYGLLLTVKPINDEGKVRLELVEDTTSVIARGQLFPDLSIPFDQRNIEWRNLFKGVEVTEAVKAGAWKYQLGDRSVPGYPNEVRVQWDKREPDLVTHAEFSPVRWDQADQRQAIVLGEQPWQRRIKVRPNEWQQFLELWLENPRDRLVWVQRLEGKVLAEWDGYLRGYTPEGVMVNVELESLSMGLFKNDQRVNLDERRLARIFRVNETRHRVEIELRENSEQVLVGDSCVGILIQAPELRAVWRTREGVCFSGVQIRGFDKAYPGWLIKGEFVHGAWQFELIERRLRARALWQRDDADFGGHRTFLADAFDPEERRIRPLAETEPGHFTFLSRYPKGARYGAVSEGLRLEGGMTAHEPVQITTRDFHKRPSPRRAVLSQEGLLLSGNCYGEVPSGDLILGKIAMKVPPPWYLPSDNEKRTPYYELTRDFFLQAAPRRRPRELEKAVPEDIELLAKNLDACLKANTDLPARYDATDIQRPIELLSANPPIKVPTDSTRKSWTAYTRIAANEGTFIFGNRYPADAMVRLVDTDAGTVEASFRRVAPLTPEVFKQRLGARFGVPISLEGNKLFYVGPEDKNPFNGESYKEVCHRFEWGYGKTVLVSESKLRFQSKLFEAADFLLYHGDEILSITFSRNPQRPDEATNPETEEGEVQSCYLHIYEVNVQFSRSRALYEQRRRYKLVHRLHLQVWDEEVVIESIDGFNPHRLTDTHPFERPPAQLDPDSQRRLIERLSGSEGERKIKVLGRLNEERFRDTYGQETRFQHVRLSFVESALGQQLTDGETVLLETGRIVKLENDIGVKVSADYLMSEDIGTDWQDARMLLRREHLSVRTDLLERISRERDLAKSGFPRRLVFVKLIKKEEYDRALPTLLRGLPPREATALYSSVSRLKNEPEFASVVKYDRAGLLLEIKPGLLVHIKPSEIAQPLPGALERGAVVRVENVPDRVMFRITLALFGDARYVPRSTRLTVALPKSDLFKEDVLLKDVRSVDFWERAKRFAIGGLTSVTASAGSYQGDQSGWLSPIPEDMIQLMMTPHPKIVQLGRDQKNEYRIQPTAQDAPVGSLHLGGDLKLKYVPLGKQPQDPDCAIVEWSSLSFGDQSAHEIILRSNREPWRYAAGKTGTWRPNGQEPEPQNLSDHNVWVGPVFLEARGRDYVLRYSRERFLEFGYPVKELFASLRLKENLRSSYPVVGPAPRGGLWIELAPGRIVEVPGQIITHRSAAEVEESLSLCHWNGFSPGDEVEFQMLSKSSTEFDRIQLDNWRPGPRKAFGWRAFLPVAAADPDKGGLLLGHGDFKLTVPTSDPARFGKLALLTSNNRVSNVPDPIAAKLLKPNDTVLLGVNTSGKPVVLGFRKLLIPRPADNMEPGDPLMQGAVIKVPSGLTLDFPHLSELIDAAGGSLPVTVENLALEDQYPTLFFSTRVQQEAVNIPFGRFNFGHLVNPVGNGHTALVRCGGGLLRLKLTDVVSGLPPTLCMQAANALKDAIVRIWLRGTADGTVAVGTSPHSDKHEILVTAICVVSANDGATSKPGLICQAVDTKALYWLPVGHVAWTDLSVDQLTRWYIGRKPFTVRRSAGAPNNSYVSATDVRAVKREVDDLKTGHEINVRILEANGQQSDGAFHHLAESFHSEILLKCITYNKSLKEGDFVPAEVVNRTISHPPTVTVVPTDEKRLQLDLPSWITGSDGITRTSFGTVSRTGNPPAPLQYSDINRAQLVQLDDENLNELLGYADTQLRSGVPERLDIFLDAGREWIRRSQAPGREILCSQALMTILILSECADLSDKNPSRFFQGRNPGDVKQMAKEWRSEAADMLRQLGRRALRSMHVEILAHSWLLHSFNQNRTDELWGRLQQLRAYFRGTTSGETQTKALSVEDINTIRQFCYAVRLRNREQLFSIATALLAAIGEPSDSLSECKDAEIMNRIVKLYRAFPPSALHVSPHQSITTELKLVLDSIEINQQDVSLLRPFATLTHLRRGSS
jgi:hypothetical protein